MGASLVPRNNRNVSDRDIRLESSNEIHAEQGVHSHLGKAILIKRRYARGI